MTGFPRQDLKSNSVSSTAVDLAQFKLDPERYFGTRKVFCLGAPTLNGYNGDDAVQGLKLYNHVSNRAIATWGLENGPDAFKFVTSGGSSMTGYYLPWKADSAYKLELGSEADYFLTAQINGCCFIVNGTRTNPTVIHANCNGQVKEDDSEEYRIAKYKRGYLNFVASLTRNGYLDEARPTTILDPEMYSGCGRVVVFGVRRGDGWTFYASLNGATQGSTTEIWPNCPKGVLPQPK